MPPCQLSLTADFMRHFGISKIFDGFSGGQKDVFIVEKNGAKEVIKLFRGFGSREERELEILTKFSHLNGIPRIIEVTNYKSQKVLIEEFIDGRSLDVASPEYEKDSTKISLLIKDICQIMNPIWLDNKVHRDLKPLNIIITPKGTPVVLDFGIARDLDSSTITDTGFQPNSWNFAAPEQYLGQKELISYRTDFFSLGIISYFLYYKALPFGNTREEVERSFRSSKLIFNTDSACALTNFFNAVLKFNPSERPRSVDLLLRSFD